MTMPASLDGDRVVTRREPYRLGSKQARDGRPSVLEVGGRKVGGEHFALIAGPSAVESRDQLPDLSGHPAR
jgi:3-deoxy-7-phosphoheptulonate synthase